jgi:flagellar biosynthesis protein FlhF
MPTVYRGRTLHDAVTAAQESLGHQAVMVSQRRVRRAGLTGLLGASDYEIEAETARAESLTQDIEALAARGPFARGVYQSDGAEPNADELTLLRRELRAVQGLVHRLSRNAGPWRDELSQLRRSIDESRPEEPTTARLRRLIARSGIDGKAARLIARDLGKVSGDDEELKEALRDALADRIKVAPWPLAKAEPLLVAVVGPPGVGKTTTAAKIGARAIEAGLEVAFVAGDTYRVAAIDQLARYAALMGAGLDVAGDGDDLRSIVRRSTADVVIVDTAGRAPDSPICVEAGLSEFAERKANMGRSRHVLLCLPAALRAVDAEDLVERYALSRPNALCITKVDLTSAPSGLLLGTVYSGLPVSTLCSGQRVPEDIAPATAGAIVDQLVPRVGGAHSES